jgi:hypothetical protein
VADLNQAAYLAQNPDVAGAVLNEAQYLADNPDVAAAVARGETTASKHYAEFGRAEGRKAVAMDTSYADAPFASGQEHYQLYGQFENRPGTSGYVAPVQVQTQQVQPEELVAQQQLSQITMPTTRDIPTAGLEVSVPTAPEGLGQVGPITRVAPQLGQMTAAQTTLSPDAQVQAAQGTLSSGALATAATEQLDQRATVSYQMDQLFKAMQGEGPMPAWASASVRKVAGIMNARGLGASSMAGAAITQAIMESGIPIAAADADKYAGIQLANLNNKQQVALQNAAAMASMDMANLNNRQAAAVQNAQNFLAVDLKNLDNEQATNVINFQTEAQALFTDAAAENARQQFNAKNELQVEEFYAELGAQVEAANKNRVSAMQQFNRSATDAMAQFNAQLQDSRDKFNTQMRYAIDQSNAVWRRNVNTQNTAMQNQANMQEAMNMFNANQAELNREWQTYRDEAQFIFNASENEKERSLRSALSAMSIEAQMKIADKDREFQTGQQLGDWAVEFIGTLK